MPGLKRTLGGQDRIVAMLPIASKPLDQAQHHKAEPESKERKYLKQFQTEPYDLTPRHPTSLHITPHHPTSPHITHHPASPITPHHPSPRITHHPASPITPHHPSPRITPHHPTSPAPPPFQPLCLSRRHGTPDPPGASGAAPAHSGASAAAPPGTHSRTLAAPAAARGPRSCPGGSGRKASRRTWGCTSTWTIGGCLAIMDTRSLGSIEMPSMDVKHLAEQTLCEKRTPHFLRSGTERSIQVLAENIAATGELQPHRPGWLGKKKDGFADEQQCLAGSRGQSISWACGSPVRGRKKNMPKPLSLPISEGTGPRAGHPPGRAGRSCCATSVQVRGLQPAEGVAVVSPIPPSGMGVLVQDHLPSLQCSKGGCRFFSPGAGPRSRG